MGVVHRSRSFFIPLTEAEILARLSSEAALFEENGLTLTLCEDGFLVKDIPQHYKDKQVGPATAQIALLPADDGTTIRLDATASPYMESIFGAAGVIAVVLIAAAAVAAAKGVSVPKESLQVLIIPLVFTFGCANSVRVFSNRILTALHNALEVPNDHSN